MRFALGETDFEECGVIQKVLRKDSYKIHAISFVKRNRVRI